MIGKAGFTTAGVAAILAGIAVPERPAESAELKFVSSAGARHMMNRKVFAPWVQEVARLSGGALTIRMAYASAPRGETGQLARMVDGGADITWASPGDSADRFRKTLLVELPGVGGDPVDATKRLWNVYNRHLAPEYSRVKVIAIWTSDAPIIHTKNREVRRIGDLKGLKVRTSSQYQAWLIGALGATPASLPADRIYDAMDRSTIDAVLIPPSAINALKLNEVTRYHSAGIAWGRAPFFAVMNKTSYSGLSKAHRDIIDRTSGRALSLKAAQIYAEKGIKDRNVLMADNKREYIELPAAEIAKADALLKRAEADILGRIKQHGIDLAPALRALRGAGG